MFKLLMEEANDGGGANGGGASGDGGATGSNTAPNIGEGAPNTGTGGESVGGGGSGAGASGGNGTSWLETLPEDIKKDPSLQTFKDPASLAKSWVNAQKMIGADKVVIPGENATDEEKAAFYNKLGRPESAEKYELKAPEGYTLDDATTKSFKEAAHKLGLTTAQANALLAFDAERQKSAVDAQGTAALNAVREELKAYEEKVGGTEKYMARVDEARVAVQATTTPEFREFLKTSGLGSRPMVIEHFAELYKMMGEGKVRDGTGVPFGNEDPAELQRQINEIEAKLFSDANASNSGRDVWIDQRSKLYERLNRIRKIS